jgi:CRISPR-associated protein Csm2
MIQNRGPRSPAPSGWRPPSDQDIEAIIVRGDAQRLVEVAEQVGQHLAQRGLKTAQIRRLYSLIRRLADESRRADGTSQSLVFRELTLLRPKLAYQAARVQEVNDLRQVLDPAIQKVNNQPERLHRLADFFEAILAYHKFHGGAD